MASAWIAGTTVTDSLLVHMGNSHKGPRVRLCRPLTGLRYFLMKALSLSSMPVDSESVKVMLSNTLQSNGGALLLVVSQVCKQYQRA